MAIKVPKIAYNKGYRIDKEGRVRGLKVKYLSLSLNSSGYLTFGLSLDGVKRSCCVHRFQGYKKFGEDIFEDGIEVRHLNGEREDNHWDNIAIGTHSENMLDIRPELRQKSAEYASSFQQKHDHEKIKKYYSNNDVTYTDIMKKFNISSKGTVSYIIRKD